MSFVERVTRNRVLLVFAAGHFTVDMYSGLMPVLYPLALTEFNLSLTSIGVIALAYGAAGSLSQPLFGYLADRHGSRWFAVVAMAWTALMVGLAGIAPTYAFLVAAATLAGLGSGAYHPQGATNAAASVGEERRNTAMSIYTVGGTSGYALGPLIGAGVFAVFGRAGTLAIAPLGFVIAFLLWRQMRNLGLGLARHQAAQHAEQRPIEWRLLAPVIVIVMLRSWVEYGAISFVPVWFKQMGYSSGYYSLLTTVILATGVAGTLFGGFMADRIGQRTVLTASMLVAFPFLILFAQFPGGWSFLFGPLFVFWAEMGLSITLVIAQRLLPGRVGVASGFILGMGFVAGSIGVPITGALADRIGIGDAISVSAVLLLIGAAISARISPRAIHYPRPIVASAAEPAG